MTPPSPPLPPSHLVAAPVPASGPWEFEPPCDSVPLEGNTNLAQASDLLRLVWLMCSVQQIQNQGNVLGWRWDEETAQVWSSCR